MAKFETVKTIEDIQRNVKRFLQILEEEEDVPVLQRFANINYWYYFSDLEIFVPNLFLGYKNSTKEFAPTPNDGHKGGDARKALEFFFDPKKDDENRYKKLYSKLEKFVKRYNRNLNSDIRNIYEPKDKFKKDLLSNVDLESTVPSKPTLYTKDTLDKIVQNAEQYETHIFRNCTNYRKRPIFERIPETKEIWNDIRTFVKSRDDFGKFIRALYKLIFETTKDEDPNNIFENGRPKPIYRLPKEFVKQGTETKHFMDIVDILRHTLGEAHTPSKLKIPEWKISYPDALYELLKSKDEPQSSGEFQKLQIEVSKRFENAMKILLEMVKQDLNHSPKTLKFPKN